jgi:hypothetical protein
MKKNKTATELGFEYLREAHIERVCKPEPVLADMWDRNATDVLTLANPPDVGAGGEVISTNPLPEPHANQVSPASIKRLNIRDTLAEGATRIAEDASVQRADLLAQPSFDVLPMAIDAADSIQAQNSLEKMLAHQLAMAHHMAMKFADRSLSYEHQTAGDHVEATRCANTVARLMGVYQDGLLTLQRLRTGGNQTVTVQHVTVRKGGQALIGNVQAGGKPRRGNKMPNSTQDPGLG